MTKINGKVEWSEVDILENEDILTGGEEGSANKQAQALANRTEWLKENLVERVNKWDENRDKLIDHVDSSPEKHIPEGGTTGQVLAKKSLEPFDVGWEDVSGDGGSTFNGGIIMAPLLVNAPWDEQGIDIRSNASGGLNDFSSTGRIQMHSWQKAQRMNNAGTQPAHYGELIRMDLEHSQAKAVVAFRENYINSNTMPRTVAWLVAHGEANDSTPDNPSWHNHFSIEVPDEGGALQTVMEFPFGKSNVANAYGLSLDDMQARTTNKLVAGNQGLWIEGAQGADRTIKFCTGKYAPKESRRWAIGMDGTTEAGTLEGSDFRLINYTNLGESGATRLFIKRSNGYTGIGTSAPTRILDVVGNAIRLRSSRTVPTAIYTGQQGDICWDENYLYVCTSNADATNGNWKRAKLETW